MKTKITIKTLLSMLAFFIGLNASASGTLEAIGYGTSNILPVASASVTVGSGTTQFLYTAASGLATAVTSATIYSGTTYASCQKLGNNSTDGTTYYLEGALTSSSSTSTISALQIGVTSGSTSLYNYAVVYSTSYPFSTSTIIGTPQVLAASLSSATSATYETATVPSTAKSFRIYRKVTISSVGYGSGSSVYVFYVGATITPSGTVAPAVTALKIAGTAGTVSASDSTIKVNLPYTTYTKGTSTLPVDSIVATTDSSSVTTQILKGIVTQTDITASGSTFTVGDTLTYIVTKNSKSRHYTIYTSADVPTPTIAATSSSITRQVVKGGAAISKIAYKLTNATGATVTGLATGLSYAVNSTADTVTISGSPTFTSYPDSATFTVTATPITGYTGSAVTATGNVIGLDPSKKQILYVATSAFLTAYASKNDTDRFLKNLKANSNYAVTTRASVAASAVTSNTYTAYDLIVLHESLNGADGSAATSPLSELAAIKTLDKPILNLKSYFYTYNATTTSTSNRWGWGTPTSTGSFRPGVKVSMSHHPIFNGVPMSGDSVVLYRKAVAKNVQGTTIDHIGGYSLAYTSTASSVAIHDIPASVRVGSTGTAKYIMVSLLNTEFSILTDTALVLLNNACSYLMDSAQYVPSSVATLSSLAVTGYSLSPAFNADSITYAVTMPAYTSVIPTTTATATSAYASTVITNATAIGGNTTVVVTAEDGTTKTYTITISDSVSTGVKTATSAFKIYGSGSAVIIEGTAGATVSLVSVSGINLYTGKTTSTKETLPVSLEKGVYIVVVDGVATKVLVK